ncbi:MAG: helix-turn-helix domain-containing protein [Vicinamibacterales bacterium]
MSDPEARRGYEQARLAFELGGRVRNLREQHGVSQSELARRIGSTQPSIARLEAGGVTPSLETLDRIATAFGLDLIVRFDQEKRPSGGKRSRRSA